MLKIAVILGSTRTKYRLGDRVAKWVISETKKIQDAEFTLLDLRDYNLPFYDEEIPPRGNKNRQPIETVARWLKDINAADGYIFITTEYNESPSAALKNAIDYIAFEVKRKPAVIVSYTDGSNGGMYAPIHLRVVLANLEAVALPTQQIIMNAETFLSEDGVAIEEQKESLERRFAKLVETLLWFTDALKTAREK